MTASTMRLVNGSDSLDIAPTIPGFTSPITLSSSSFIPPPVRVVNQQNVSRSGMLDLSYLHDDAQFQATLEISDDANYSRYIYLDMLKALLAPDKRSYLYVQRDGWSTERRALLRGDPMSCTVGQQHGTWIEVALAATIPDGVFESPDTSIVTLHASDTTTTGVSYPRTYPFSYTPSNSPSTYLVNVNGTTRTPPIIRIYGSCSNPIITQTFNGLSSVFALTNITIPAGHYLDIDVANRRVYMDSTFTNSFYDRINFSVSTWWELQGGNGISPGVNEVVFNATGTDSACYATITFRDRWII